VLITLAVVAELVALLGLVAHFHTPRSLTALGLAVGSPYLGVGAVVAAVLFGIGRGTAGWVGLGTAVVTLAGVVLIQLPLFVASAAPAGTTEVRVMTANLRLGRADPAAVVAAVRTHHVDVLMLEELTLEEADALHAAGLNDLLPHRVAVPDRNAAGTGLWSRYPLTDAEVRHDFGFALVIARVQVPGSSPWPTAVALHMYGPYPAAQTPRWLDDMHRLPALLAGLPGDAPVLVGGDFNASADVAQFRRLLTGGYADAADQAGAGFTPTYPADRFFPPMIAIDHVLTRDAIGRRVDTVEITGSDHRALVVDVRLGSA
jgi:endonuclease/exonuclease/phosphatase (EEP) superfamily protein YafD